MTISTEAGLITAPFGGRLQVKLRLTLEVEGSEKPAVVADQLVRVYA